MGFLVDSSVKPVSSLEPIVFLSKRSAKATALCAWWDDFSVPQERNGLQGPGKESRRKDRD